jgi:tetratricopeptide (TPR) repeat protein
MKRWVWLLALSLALPAGADDKKKDEKKKDEKKPPAVAVPTGDLLKQADEKAAAGDQDGALELLRKAQGVEATAGEASLRLGRALEAKYDLDVAIDAYRIAGEKLSGPDKGEALGRMAILQDARGMADANATAQAASAADPAGPWPTIAMSRLRAREGKGDEAVDLAQKAAAAGGGAAASSALGFAQVARGDMVAAEAAYREALAKTPGFPSATIGLARVLRRTGRAAEAEPLLQKVIESAPGAVDAYKELARVKMALNRASDAVGDASLAAAMAENDPDAQHLAIEVKAAKALESLAQGQGALAVQDLTALRDQNPEVAEVRLALAKALVAQRQADAAIVELQKAADLDPKDGEALFQLGYVNLVLKGNPAGAVGPFEKAVALDPGNANYRTNLGAALNGQKQYDRAIAELGKVTASPEYNRADAWIYLGQAYVGAKRYKEAVPALEKATAVAPNSDQAYATLGWAYFGLKDADNFKKAAGKARSLGYKEPTLLQYLGRIEAGEPIK